MVAITGRLRSSSDAPLHLMAESIAKEAALRRQSSRLSLAMRAQTAVSVIKKVGCRISGHWGRASFVMLWQT